MSVAETRTELRTIPAQTHGRVNLGKEVTALCPYDDLRDHYTVHIRYTPGDECLELQSLSAFLDSFEDEELTQEAFCERVYDAVVGALNPERLEVAVEGGHYGINTEVVRTL